MLSTFLSRRITSIQFPPDNQIKTDRRGTMIEKECVLDGMSISAIKWYDNRGVHLLSNFVGSLPEIQRYDRKVEKYVMVPCPNAIFFYNKFMGGIDSFDSYIALYRTKTKATTKFYLKIYFHIVDMMVINSWLLYRLKSTTMGISKIQNLMPLWDFNNSIAQTLCQNFANIKRPRFSEVSHDVLIKKKKGPTAVLPTDYVRRDGKDHLPLIQNRGRCKKPGCTGIVKTYCSNAMCISAFQKKIVCMNFTFCDGKLKK